MSDDLISRKAFILVDIEKEYKNEVKAKTASGTEVYIDKGDLIPYTGFPKGNRSNTGSVMINGMSFTAKDVMLLIQLCEGLSKQNEDLKVLYRRKRL